MRALLSAALVLTSCVTVHGAGGRAVCRTPCGMTATEGDCESLQRFEGMAIERLADAVWEYSVPRLCTAVAGWKIVIHHHDPVLDKGCSEEGWRLSPTFCASGLTQWADNTITLGSTDWRSSALAHEIVHVAEGKPGHCRWRDLRMRQALQDITGEVDTNPPEPECYPDAGVSR